MFITMCVIVCVHECESELFHSSRYLYDSTVVSIFGRCEAVTNPSDLLAHLHAPPLPG